MNKLLIFIGEGQCFDLSHTAATIAAMRGRVYQIEMLLRKLKKTQLEAEKPDDPSGAEVTHHSAPDRLRTFSEERKSAAQVEIRLN